MEGFGGSGLSGMAGVAKKRRSATSRRPRPDSQFVVEGRDISPPSSTPSSENAGKLSPDDNAGYDANVRRKEFSLNSSSSRVASVNRIEGYSASRKIKKEDRKFGDVEGFYGGSSSRSGLSGPNEQGRSGSDLRRCSEGVLAPANWKSAIKVKENVDMKSVSPDSYTGKNSSDHNVSQSIGSFSGSAENKLKVKLKVGGVTHTIHTKSKAEIGNDGSTSGKPARSSDAPRHRQKLILQENSDDDQSPPGTGNSMQGVSWKDFGGGSFPQGTKEDSRGKGKEENLAARLTDKSQITTSSEPVRKSTRVPKRRVLDGEFGDGNEDDGMRYIERLKTSKVVKDYNVVYEDDREDNNKKRRLSKASKSRRAGYDVDEDYRSRSAKDSRKRLRTGRESDDIDYIEEEEEEPVSDAGPDSKKKKLKESVEPLTDARVEPLTTRQRALQSSKDGGSGTSVIEFPNGLPPAPPRKQKEKLSEMEQQAKKAEAAQRRRMQVEKANRELEAAAISKILGQDSKKKKKEEEKLKERDEKEQEKAANALAFASKTIRCVMGPTGTVLSFGTDVSLPPSIFDSKPCCYPPPREKCAGPYCSNTYKYRDSRTNLPLCSLRCYKAVQQQSQSLATC